MISVLQFCFIIRKHNVKSQHFFKSPSALPRQDTRLTRKKFSYGQKFWIDQKWNFFRSSSTFPSWSSFELNVNPRTSCCIESTFDCPDKVRLESKKEWESFFKSSKLYSSWARLVIRLIQLCWGLTWSFSTPVTSTQFNRNAAFFCLDFE